MTIPLAPRTTRAIDLAIGERADGPVFLAADGRRLDRHGAGRIVRRTARRAGIGKTVTPHTLRHAFITAASTQGCRCARSRKQHRTLTRRLRSGTTGPAAAWTGTPPTSWPHISRAPPGNPRRSTTAPPGGRNRQADNPQRPSGTRRGSHGLRPQYEREPPIWAGCDRDLSVLVGGYNWSSCFGFSGGDSLWSAAGTGSRLRITGCLG